MVLIADPQLVDPHTYPGRPWPLSSLTETYTDMYMARNFKLINDKLDPDSVVFLGDLFDGGREWATDGAKPYSKSVDETVRPSNTAGAESQGADDKANGNGKRDAVAEQESPDETESEVDAAFNAPLTFEYREGGRWSKWGTSQWNVELERFGNIFFAPEQLYPHADRSLVAGDHVETHPVAIQNGASYAAWQEQGISGGKQRRVLSHLPGNHDLGLGAGVQRIVRARFRSRFGESNRVDVLGNHTFISVDALSYSAFSQFVPPFGEETPVENQNGLAPIWQPVSEFLEDVDRSSKEAVGRALGEYYPASPSATFWHEVTDANDISRSPTPRSDVGTPGPQLPVILLTHIPLYRSPDVDCGRLREKGSSIPISYGYQYQNVLTSSLTNLLVKKTATAGEIAHVFSGDDHDYCDVVHRFNIGARAGAGKKERVELKTFHEITVKSFSWAMGVRLPGFLLVSLWNPVDEKGHTIGSRGPTVQTHLCLLPDQLEIFIRYGSLLGITLVVLLVRAVIMGVRHRPDLDEDSSDEETHAAQFSLPRYKPQPDGLGESNGYAANGSAKFQSRHRATSTSMASHGVNTNQLSVQRSLNARNRSVSPAVGFAASAATPPKAPLIEKAGYYPQLRWDDPGEDSDEEPHLGNDADSQPYDSHGQAKWKRRRRRPKGKVMEAVVEFGASVAWVAVPAALYYAVLIKNG